MFCSFIVQSCFPTCPKQAGLCSIACTISRYQLLSDDCCDVFNHRKLNFAHCVGVVQSFLPRPFYALNKIKRIIAHYNINSTNLSTSLSTLATVPGQGGLALQTCLTPVVIKQIYIHMFSLKDQNFDNLMVQIQKQSQGVRDIQKIDNPFSIYYEFLYIFINIFT